MRKSQELELTKENLEKEIAKLTTQISNLKREEKLEFLNSLFGKYFKINSSTLPGEEKDSYRYFKVKFIKNMKVFTDTFEIVNPGVYTTEQRFGAGKSIIFYSDNENTFFNNMVEASHLDISKKLEEISENEFLEEYNKIFMILKPKDVNEKSL